MFIGVSMQLQAVFKYFLSHTVGRLPLKKKKKKKKKGGGGGGGGGPAEFSSKGGGGGGGGLPPGSAPVLFVFQQPNCSHLSCNIYTWMQIPAGGIGGGAPPPPNQIPR